MGLRHPPVHAFVLSFHSMQLQYNVSREKKIKSWFFLSINQTKTVALTWVFCLVLKETGRWSAPLRTWCVLALLSSTATGSPSWTSSGQSYCHHSTLLSYSKWVRHTWLTTTTTTSTWFPQKTFWGKVGPLTSSVRVFLVFKEPDEASSILLENRHVWHVIILFVIYLTDVLGLTMVWCR